MEAISFEIGGKTAFFKKPDVNSYAYFTYNNIHKPVLLGLFGAILGCGGYTKLYEKNRYFKKGGLGYDGGFPEYYEKLKNFKISIIPIGNASFNTGYFPKKIQTFNNSVGYASKEAGGNLIIREQWLENPKWKIIVLDDKSNEYKKLKESLLNSKTIYIPYLGKNDHPAIIEKVEVIELKEELYSDDELYIDSLFIKDTEIEDGFQKEGEIPFVFQEVSPISLQEEYHIYEYKTLCFTNYELEKAPKDTFSYKNKNYTFL